MFVALVPAQSACEHLEDFLEPRHDLTWVDPSRWHITLTFMGAVPERNLDELTDRLRAACARQQPFEVSLRGAGCFPDPSRARVLWLQPVADAGTLRSLAQRCRSAANAAGAQPDGTRFVEHLTVARLRRTIEASKWLRVLDTYAGPSWCADHAVLVESHLGAGRSGHVHHETVDVLPFGSS
jgi:2'-5' RNA ligase